MPMERRRSAFGTPQSPAAQLFGSAFQPVPPVGTTRPFGSRTNRASVNKREPSWIERIDYDIMPHAPTIFKQPAVFAERPVAFADAATGGGISGAMKSIGDFGGSGGNAGPIGQFFKGIGDGIIAADTAGRAWANSSMATLWAKNGHKADTDFVDGLPGQGGILDFFGLGQKMTVGELREEITARGWQYDPKTSQSMGLDELQELAKRDPFAFGDRALSRSVALDMGLSMVVSPVNALFFVPGAGWVAAANKVRGVAGATVGRASWARAVTTASGGLLKSSTKYGHGYIKYMSGMGLRAPHLPEIATGARMLLEGSTKSASMRSLAKAADLVLRGGGIAARGAQKFTGFKAPARPTAWGYSKALGGAYFRGAFRLQVGSTAAEGASGYMNDMIQDSILDDTIFDGGTHLINSALKNLNNSHPLSDNETFMLFALTTMPSIPLLKEHTIDIPGKAAARAKGANDAVLIAKELGFKNPDELFLKAGDGNATKGREIITWALQQAERGAAFRELSLATRHLGSWDAFVTHNQFLNSVIGSKVSRMREAGQLRAETRVQTFLDVVRKGEIVSQADRPFEWNASPDAILKFWGRFHTAWTALSPGAQKMGVTNMRLSKLVTREMAEDALTYLRNEAPSTGVVPDWVQNEVLLNLPGLLEDLSTYGQFWARFAQHSENLPTYGRAATKGGRAKADNRVQMEELITELESLTNELPPAAEVYHEAAAIEKAQPEAPTVDLLKGNTLRKVHSPARVKELREDATANVRELRLEESALVEIRNSEFTRNGLPKHKQVQRTVGYDGTIFRKTSDIGPDGNPVHPDRSTFRFSRSHDPEAPSQVMHLWDDGRFEFELDYWVDSTLTSEAIVKAVELGGRTIVAPASGGRTLAKHGFVEVARGTKQRANLAAGIVEDYEVGYYAYAGGPAGSLRQKLLLNLDDIDLKEVEVDIPAGWRVLDDRNQRAWLFRQPKYPETVPVRLIEEFAEVNREVTPKYANDPGYLDRLTDDLEKKIMEEGPLSIDPITLEVDPFTQEAMVTDGNHRIAVYKRLEEKYGRTLDIGVQIKFTNEGFAGGMREPINIRHQLRKFESTDEPTPITVQGILGYVKSQFPEYKPVKRVVKSDAAGYRMAQRRADSASLLVPSMEAIGPSPFNADGIFHGSSNAFEQFSNQFRNSSDFIGAGVFMTDAGNIALGYSMKDAALGYFGHTGDEGYIYRIELPKEVKSKMYDAMQPMSKNIRQKIEAIPDMPAFAEDVTLFDVYRMIFDQGDFQPIAKINDDIRQVLIDEGFEGLTHTGGLIMGDGQHTHTVSVVFDADKVKILERIRNKDIIPATPARHTLITKRTQQIREQQKAVRDEIALIDKRADELRTIKLPEDLTELSKAIPRAERNGLIELVSEARELYPSYELSAEDGIAFWDPNDGLIPALNLERTTAQRILYDYGPLSKISAFYNAMFAPVSSKRLSKMARTTVYNRMLTEGATTKQIGQILSELNQRVREQTVGPLRVPWFRDITSLPAQQVNTIAKRHLDEAVWAQIEKRYGRNGFHRLLDESANEFVRRVDKATMRNQETGSLAGAMREGYRLWTNTPVVGSTTRLISKQFYHIFRFMLDLRWHFLNLIEADVLSIAREGIGATRFGKQSGDTGRAAMLQHSNKAGIPQEFFTKGNKAAGEGPGPASSMELFDVGLYLHNKNILPVVTKNFDRQRIRSVEQVLDELPANSSLYRMLEERFGRDTRTWSQQLDDMMYSFDTKGVRETVFAQARKDGWTKEDFDKFGGVLERITELNQRSYDDLVQLYTGNLNRTRIERVLNSYWMYWPISYQIKATRWMLNSLLNRWGGMQTNMTGLYLFNRMHERFNDLLANNPQFQHEMSQNEDLWFAASMLFPATPMDTGVALNRGVRYATSLVAPDIIPPYIGIDGAEDVPIRMLEMGPIFTAKFIQSIVNRSKKDPSRPRNSISGRPVSSSPAVLPSP